MGVFNYEGNLQRSYLREAMAMIEATKTTPLNGGENVEEGVDSDERSMLPPNVLDIDRGLSPHQREGGSCRIAFAGAMGVGKSALVNAIRGLRPREAGAAQENYVESVMETGVYPSTENHRVTYYDIPGGDPYRYDRHEYFKKHCLYIMDAVIVVHDYRVTPLDLDIIKKCILLRIPVLVVRTKCDHIVWDIRAEVEEELEEREGSVVVQIREAERHRIELEVSRRVEDFKKRYKSIAVASVSESFRGARVFLNRDVDQSVFMVNKRSLYKRVKLGINDENTMDESRLLDTFTRLISCLTHSG